MMHNMYICVKIQQKIVFSFTDAVLFWKAQGGKCKNVTLFSSIS